MGIGLHPDLLAATGITATIGFALLARVVGWRWALVLAAVKFGLVFSYFAFWNDGTWGILDDEKYIEESHGLLAEGETPWSLISSPESRALLFSTAGGRHVGYYFVNVVAQYIFGEHYFSPVLLNVVFACLAVVGFARILRLAGMRNEYVRACSILYALHWDILAWSSFLNIKDILVQALTVWTLAWGLTSWTTRRVMPLVASALCAGVLLVVRWYAPALCLGAAGLWALQGSRGARRASLVVLGAVALLAGLRLAPSGMIHPLQLPEGAVRFFFTPRPWGIRPSYTFLQLPALMHWLLTPVALWGAVCLWRRYPLARLILLYLVVAVSFYAVVPKLQGPRQRSQLAFALTWAQFHGLYVLLAEVTSRMGRDVRRRSPTLRGRFAQEED